MRGRGALVRPPAARWAVVASRVPKIGEGAAHGPAVQLYHGTVELSWRAGTSPLSAHCPPSLPAMASAAFCALLIAHISETDGTPASATRNNAEAAFADAELTMDVFQQAVLQNLHNASLLRRVTSVITPEAKV